MPELRTDWLLGRTVLVAENRALRPNEFTHPPGEPASAGGPPATLHLNCPFCLGNEPRTPPAVFELLDEQSRWRVRVVPNMFPAVESTGVSGALPSAEAESPSDEILKASVAIGAHEVIIESPRHVDRLSALSVREVRDVLEAYVERLRHWRGDARLKYAMVFKNQGPRAGASLAHLHSQLVALPFIPPAVEAEIERATHAFQQQKRCAYCSLLDQERSAAKRIVFDGDGFIAFCPFASWQPFEVWLLPAEHQPSFERMPAAALDQLANVLQQLVSRLEAAGADSDFNMLLRTAPWRGEYDDVCHWRIELLPRANSLAGLEVGTGIHINPLPPEHAAEKLLSVAGL